MRVGGIPTLMLAECDPVDWLGDYAERLRAAEVELLVAIHIGGGGAIIARRITSDNAPCHIEFPLRMIVCDALNLGSRSVLIAHNHPSGIAKPSKADLKHTRILSGVLCPLGITLSDHLIVTEREVCSLKAEGFI